MAVARARLGRFAAWASRPGAHPLGERAEAANAHEGVDILRAEPGRSVTSGSEIQRAVKFGFTWLTARNAAQLTPGWFAAPLAPFPDLRPVVAVGSALSDPARLARLHALGLGRSPGARADRP